MNDVRISPSIGHVRFIRIVCGHTGRSDCQNPFVFAFPRMLGHQKAFQIDIVFERHHICSDNAPQSLQCQHLNDTAQSIYSGTMWMAAFVIFHFWFSTNQFEWHTSRQCAYIGVLMKKKSKMIKWQLIAVLNYKHTARIKNRKETLKTSEIKCFRHCKFWWHSIFNSFRALHTHTRAYRRIHTFEFWHDTQYSR